MRRWRRSGPSLTAKPQALLALLLLKPDVVANRDWLVDQLWGDAPPAAAVATLRTYAYQLRRRLAADDRIALHGKGGGYLLQIPPDALDSARFEALTAVRRLDDQVAQATLSRLLAGSWIELGRRDEAQVFLERAMAHSRAAGDRTGEAHAHYMTGRLLRMQGRLSASARR
ncbi:winged helix-turn-helix domain-containing protein [Glycomyces sp. NPDC047010]|uniref:AfsR/SARP family transcriptional regulator n=1 Tax=Glycomyces sp. NPDC047010 TaxID=3155023 RepID=UPI0033D49317